MGLRIAYRGNFDPPFSTENHVAASMELLGHEVIRLQEDQVSWPETVETCWDADLFWWTQTYGLAVAWPRREAIRALELLDSVSIPTISFHLDLFFGLNRAHQVEEEPFFHTKYVYTADGGHDDEWRARGINHRWSPPAVYGPECVMGRPRARYRSDVAFVGSWRHYGHEEWWPERKRMLDTVTERFGSQFRCWPKGRAVRGRALNDLYASVKVVVGDSCLAGTLQRYWSDRIPETLGRGGFLIHPRVDGLEEYFVEDEHLVCYEPGNFAELCDVIEFYLQHPKERMEICRSGHEHVKLYHTYERRVEKIIDELKAEKVI